MTQSTEKSIDKRKIFYSNLIFLWKEMKKVRRIEGTSRISPATPHRNQLPGEQQSVGGNTEKQIVFLASRVVYRQNVPI